MAITGNFHTEFLDGVCGLVASDKLNISEAIFNRSYQVSDITKSHKVLTGIRSGNLIPIINEDGSYESFPFANLNDCSKNECDVDLNFSKKKWELALLECRVPICMRTFDEEFLDFWNEFRVLNPDDSDLNKGFLAYISKVVSKGLLNAQWRAAYFGDKSSTSNLFNGIDGFFTQAQAIPVNIIPIEENEGATYPEQKFTNKDRIYDILNEMHDSYMDQDWFEEKENVEFKMTKLDATAYLKFLNSNDVRATCCDAVRADGVMNGSGLTIDNLNFNGIPVRVMREWDRVINKTSELNGGGANNARVQPHRILLTYKDNLLLGTSEIDDLNFFDIFYDKKDGMVYIDANSYLGASIPLDNYILAI